MLGATVMPHAIYLHSALSRDRHGRADGEGLAHLLRATRIDVVAALALAGAVNIAMLLLAASSLGGASGTDTIAGAHAAITDALGPVIGAAFAVGLLASGLASTSVGSYAGATIMAGLMRIRVPLLVRRVVTLLPAVVILALGVEPTWALVLSQVLLSLGIPFAMIPLLRLTGSRAVMGDRADGLGMRILGIVIAGLVVVLNVALVVLTVAAWLG
jgi:manganese transport protein